MGIILNTDAYKKLIEADISWLEKIMEEHCPDSLEGKHIKEVLKESVDSMYATNIVNRLLDNPTMSKVVKEFNDGLSAYMDIPWPFNKPRLKKVDILLDRLAKLVTMFKENQ